MFTEEKCASLFASGNTNLGFLILSYLLLSFLFPSPLCRLRGEFYLIFFLLLFLANNDENDTRTKFVPRIW